MGLDAPYSYKFRRIADYEMNTSKAHKQNNHVISNGRVSKKNNGYIEPFGTKAQERALNSIRNMEKDIGDKDYTDIQKPVLDKKRVVF